MPFDAIANRSSSTDPGVRGVGVGSYLQRRKTELRRWHYRLAALALPAAAILWGGFVALQREPAGAHPDLMPLLFVTLAALLAAAGYGWRRAARLAERLIAEAERHAVQELDAEAELQTLQFEYRDIFLNHPAPMWIFELKSLRFLAVNDAACAEYGYSRGEFLSMTIRDLCPVSELSTLERQLAMPRPSLQNAGVWKQRRKDGAVIDAEIVSHEMVWRGRKVWLVTATDVTKRIAAEERLTELNANLAALVNERTLKLRRYAHKLRERKQELEIVNRDLEMFSYTASHDLRTPLFVMNIFIDMLLTDFAGEMPAEAAGHIRKIQTATRNMTALVDDLMRLAKVSKQAMQRRATDLGELAAAQVAMLRDKEPERAVALEIEPGLQVDADPGLLALALENLLGNAWKYSAYVPQARIHVGRVRRSDEEVFYVRDNGAGFDMQDARDLFKPFYRMHGEDKFEGTGIGLAIVQRIIALHGGRVWAEARVDEGATFYFTLGAEAA